MPATLATLTVFTDNPFLDGRVTADFFIRLDWKSTDLGVVSFALASTYATQQAALHKVAFLPVKVYGRLVSIETVPGLAGDWTTTLPTDAYDCTLKDNYGLDVADGNLANRSGTVAEQVVFDTPIKISSELTLAIAAAGDAKTGRMILHFMGE